MTHKLKDLFSNLNISVGLVPFSSTVFPNLAMFSPAKGGRTMKRLHKNQKGQGIMEYVIISSLVGICCLIAVKEFGEVVKKRIDNMKGQITDELTLRDRKR